MSDFFVLTRRQRAHDCKDAAIRRPGGRAKQEARAENRSVYEIHEDSTEPAHRHGTSAVNAQKAPLIGTKIMWPLVSVTTEQE